MKKKGFFFNPPQTIWVWGGGLFLKSPKLDNSAVACFWNCVNNFCEDFIESSWVDVFWTHLCLLWHHVGYKPTNFKNVFFLRHFRAIFMNLFSESPSCKRSAGFSVAQQILRIEDWGLTTKKLLKKFQFMCGRSVGPKPFWGLRIEVWGLRIEDWGLRIEDWGLRIEDWGLRIEDWGLRIEDWGLRIENLALRSFAARLKVQ